MFGRTAASVKSFEYSAELRRSRIQWDAATLDKWLADPDSVVSGTDMAFRMANAEERAAVIAYLREVSR